MKKYYRLKDLYSLRSDLSRFNSSEHFTTNFFIETKYLFIITDIKINKNGIYKELNIGMDLGSLLYKYKDMIPQDAGICVNEWNSNILFNRYPYKFEKI